jgi:hypothetical protein
VRVSLPTRQCTFDEVSVLEQVLSRFGPGRLGRLSKQPKGVNQPSNRLIRRP